MALTHRSHANEQGLEQNYERLEFLGDAVLGLVTAEWLFRRYTQHPEGTLSKLKSQLVSARSLARYARGLGLGEALRLGVGEERSGGRGKRSLLADSLEAVFGAVYLDGGPEAARKVVEAFLLSVEGPSSGNASAPEAPEDPKTDLQELLQARGWELPEYRVVAEIGPDHDKRFAVECWAGGECRGRGEGRSKKLAQQAAAADALTVLHALPPESPAPPA